MVLHKERPVAMSSSVKFSLYWKCLAWNLKISGPWTLVFVFYITLHNKWIRPVNKANPQLRGDLITFTEEFVNRKLYAFKKIIFSYGLDSMARLVGPHNGDIKNNKDKK